MKIGKRLVMQIGLACLLILISLSVSAETPGADTSEEKRMSEEKGSLEDSGSGQDMNMKKGTGEDIRYVRDFIVITLRAGMGDEYKVLETLKTDARLQVLQETDEFLRVKTEKGEEGWVRSRYVAPDLPKPFIIAGLRNEKEKLGEEVTDLKKKITEMSEQRSVEIGQSDNTTKQLQSQLKESENKIAALEKEKAMAESKYNKLLTSSSNVANLLKELEEFKKKNLKLNKEMGELQNTNQLLENDKEDLVRLRLLKWFLSGSGVLFVGFIVGWIFRRKDYY
jgi:SH3 domain protein